MVNEFLAWQTDPARSQELKEQNFFTCRTSRRGVRINRRPNRS
jgi:hypothetical protein